MQQLGEIRRPPEIENILELNTFDKIPKTLVIERRQLFENGFKEVGELYARTKIVIDSSNVSSRFKRVVL